MIDLITAAAEEGHHVVNELAMPPVMFGVIAMVLFLVLTWVTFLARNSANRHPEHSEVHPYVPFQHGSGDASH
ncbi:hypothetical protein F8O01_08990 [Pseudoclavibacter chungangensis]|uniref:Uncharacterized protein n=1 Tax=Pseudoclavibacter chungangensis TaxID=587635 RepID=A0A7J5BTB6_9MICO|nr:hypothetical protein [Pseudoclavibacter chungangensis]KAB1656787.1 hypothetical protein F8O01_08990 [Pseudoclavibacter chungangensis]NYJ67233.1 heme/copper-type cytochrome/quinol oxidase subunit 2 [Pseudoclavibacter chungangensis]